MYILSDYTPTPNSFRGVSTFLLQNIQKGWVKEVRDGPLISASPLSLHSKVNEL